MLLAGVHLVAERPLCLRRVLRVHHALLDKRRWWQRLVVWASAPGFPITLLCLLQSGESIMVEVAAGPSDSATHEKVSLNHACTSFLSSATGWMTSVCCLFQLPMVLKVPRLNSSPLALCDRPFSLLGFGDILVPGNWDIVRCSKRSFHSMKS